MNPRPQHGNDEAVALVRSAAVAPAADRTEGRAATLRVGGVLQLAELRTRLDAAVDAPEIAAVAIKLAAHLRDLNRYDTAVQILAEAVARLDASEREHLRPIAELHRAAGDPDQASVWFEHAAAAGDPHAFDDELGILWARELPPASDRYRQVLRDLPSPSRELVAATTFIGIGLPGAATLMGMTVEEAKEHELTGLRALDAHLHGRGRPGSEPPDSSTQGLAVDDLNIGGVVRTGGFDANFEDPSTMPGQVIGGTLTNDERAMIQLMDPKDRARYPLQKRI